MSEIRFFDGNPYAEYVAACDDDSCGNFNISLAVWGDADNPEVGCGACHKHSIPFISASANPSGKIEDES